MRELILKTLKAQGYESFEDFDFSFLDEREENE